MGTVLSLQPQRSVAQGESKEEKVREATMYIHTCLVELLKACKYKRGMQAMKDYCLLTSKIHFGSPFMPSRVQFLLQVLNLASDVLKHVPELIDYESTYKLVCDDMNPLNVVLLQEVVYMHAYIHLYGHQRHIKVTALIKGKSFLPRNFCHSTNVLPGMGTYIVSRRQGAHYDALVLHFWSVLRESEAAQVLF